LLHPGGRPTPLSEVQLRQAIEDAIAGRRGAFLYAPDLIDKLAARGVSIQDLLHVCHTWLVMTAEWDDPYCCWRYMVEGPNLDARWMLVVLAHNTVPKEEFIAITGFRYSRGKKKYDLQQMQ